MKTGKIDIFLSGVGGQGIISIATIIGEAATEAGLFLKQSEVHGMSQRGGSVYSNLRLSCSEIYSEQIPMGKADLIIAMEPMEALRYVPYLAPDGQIVANSRPLVNIPNYPDQQALAAELEALPHYLGCDIEALAAEHKMPRGANMILFGMAAPFLKILTPEQLREAIGKIFAAKGDAVVESNCEAFDLGLSLASK